MLFGRASGHPDEETNPDVSATGQAIGCIADLATVPRLIGTLVRRTWRVRRLQSGGWLRVGYWISMGTVMELWGSVVAHESASS